MRRIFLLSFIFVIGICGLIFAEEDIITNAKKQIKEQEERIKKWEEKIEELKSKGSKVDDLVRILEKEKRKLEKMKSEFEKLMAEEKNIIRKPFSPNFKSAIYQSEVYSERRSGYISGGKEVIVKETKKYKVWFKLLSKKEYKFRMELEGMNNMMIFDSSKNSSNMFIYEKGKNYAIKFPVYPFQIGILLTQLSEGSPLVLKGSEKVENIACDLFEYYTGKYPEKKLAGKLWISKDKGFIVKWVIITKKTIITITNRNAIFDTPIKEEFFSLPPDIEIKTL